MPQLPATADDYLRGVRDGDRNWLSRAITLVESTNPEDRVVANRLVDACLDLSRPSFRLGVTGVPGAGKSTLINVLGQQWTDAGHRVAVLAIDPSSPIYQGSVLGDKTRMAELSSEDEAFVRPSPSTGRIGGIAGATRESIVLCEACGYDRVIVETVGVGQSEAAADTVVDCVVLLLVAGAGDELQGIKRGVLETTDIVAIAKCDGDNLMSALSARDDYRASVSLLPDRPGPWSRRVVTCSAITKEGLDHLNTAIDDFEQSQLPDRRLEKRKQQMQIWFEESVEHVLQKKLKGDHAVRQASSSLVARVSSGEISPRTAAEALASAVSIRVDWK